MKLFSFLVLFISMLFSYGHSLLTPQQALDRLVKGNERHIKNETVAPRISKEKREELAEGQFPFAVIVSCSDSRFVPEILFDQSLGDLFVVRVAGNVIGPLEMESILYAVDNLHSPCVVVMGHEHCGAVNAVLTGNTDDVRFIAQLIEPSVLKAKAMKSKSMLESSIKFNAQNMSKFISESPTIKRLIKENKVVVKSAYCSLSQGLVEILE